jgi:hypothetical protein
VQLQAVDGLDQRIRPGRRDRGNDLPAEGEVLANRVAGLGNQSLTRSSAVPMTRLQTIDQTATLTEPVDVRRIRPNRWTRKRIGSGLTFGPSPEAQQPTDSTGSPAVWQPEDGLFSVIPA